MYRYLFILLLVGFSGKKENDPCVDPHQFTRYQPNGVKGGYMVQ
jgi:hypothetical protein